MYYLSKEQHIPNVYKCICGSQTDKLTRYVFMTDDNTVVVSTTHTFTGKHVEQHNTFIDMINVTHLTVLVVG